MLTLVSTGLLSLCRPGRGFGRLFIETPTRGDGGTIPVGGVFAATGALTRVGLADSGSASIAVTLPPQPDVI